MSQRRHPLNALRAFEAAARHGSFAKAADALHVTPAAVSHQVKNLEDYLGVQLFWRLPRGLTLSDAGKLLLPELSEGFAQLDRAVDRLLDGGSTGILAISVAPMFAVKWLVPRLPDFAERHPELDLRVSSSLTVIDPQRDGFDAAIRLGDGRYPGLAAIELFGEAVTPMCSPRLLELGPPLATPDDLRHHALLHDESMQFDAAAPTWRTWLEAAGAADAFTSRGPRFGQPDHALQAAIDGAGIALGWACLAAEDLAAGRLVAPFDRRLPLGAAFYLVYPASHADWPKIRALRTWLVRETAAVARWSV